MTIIDEHELQDFIRTSPDDKINVTLAYIYDKLRELDDNHSILQGSGSPEGAVAAQVTRLYMDTAGTAGNILYIKKSGSGDTGWILV